MDLLEYQGKQLFAEHGVPVPEGRHAATVDDAVAAANEIGYPCVVKAQVAIGKRGKAGGIKVARDEDEARAHSEAILGMDIRGFTVHDLWIEQASEISSEYYASVILDRSEKKLLAMLSSMGGMDVEEMAETDPDALVRRHVEPGREFGADAAHELAVDAGIDEDVTGQVAEMLVKLVRLAFEEDATLIEVNPLIVTGDRRVIALDSKATIDNALFRHPSSRSSPTSRPRTRRRRWRRRRGSPTSSSAATSASWATAPACACRRSTSSRRRGQAGQLPRRGRGVEGGGDRRCARGDHLGPERHGDPLQHLRRDHPLRRDRQGDHRGLAADQITVPLVVRLDGTNSEEGLGILADAELGNLHVEQTMLGAAEAVVELAR